jgi:hypothetical protein
MSNTITATLGTLLVLLGAPLALAHHSAAMYDFTKNVWVSGVVKDIRVINPHMSLTLEVSPAAGTEHDIQFEGHSVNNFYRAGWRPGLLKAGDKIKVRTEPKGVS